MSRVLLVAVSLLVGGASAIEAQVYGYTDDNGVLILSNVPSGDRMRLIVDGTAEEAGKMWRYTGQYDDMILKASRLFGVDSALVRAVIAVESAFNRYARSHKGARGLMQLMPSTARQYGVVNVYDPWQNIRGGTAHLKDLIDDFGDLRLALAAYNAGSTPVRRYDGIPPYAETRNYVRKVMAIYRAGSKIQIVKGGKVYSIGQPGGKTQVKVLRGTARRPSKPGAPMSPLAALAARSRQQPESPRSTTPKETAQPPRPQLDTGSVSYYRFVDPDGIVRITRRRPDSYPYDVLDP